MKKFFSLAVLFCCLISKAQVQFENGYYIDNSGVKHQVLIQNSDPKDNPTSITYQTKPGSEVKTAGMEDVQEYQVAGNLFIRSTVNIDRTKEDIRSLSNSPDPSFKQETIFLKMLLDGKADLFLYRDGSLQRYFYRVDQSNIDQLVFLKYFKEPNKLASNNQFQQQLFNHINCEALSTSRYKTIEYKTSSLIDLFKDYNTCKNVEYQTFLGPEVKGGFNFRIKVGAGLSDLGIKKNMTNTDFKFENLLEPRLGVELEYILPFNRNKWGVFAEATYRKSSYEETFETNYSGLFKFKYSSLEMYGGLRHYFFLNEKSKLFVNGGVLLDNPLSSKASILETSRVMDPEVGNFDLSFSGAFGIGYEFSNKFSAEVRYTSRDIYGRKEVDTHYDLTIDSKYSSLSFILGYNIL